MKWLIVALLSILGACQDGATQSRALLPGQTSTTVRLDVYYVRHAQSCANVAEGWNKFTYQDPEITNCGVYRSLEAGRILANKNITFDFIGASRLRRTKETALMTFYTNFFGPSHATLYQLPYIGEIETTVQVALTPENIPFLTPTQTGLIVKAFPQINASQMSTLYTDGTKLSINVDYNKFTTVTLAKIAYNLFNAATEKKLFNLAVFTHSNFMSKIIDCTGPGAVKPQNNEVYQVSYYFKVDGAKATLLDSPAPSACANVIPLTRDAQIEDIDQQRCGTEPGSADGSVFNFPVPADADTAISSLRSKVSYKCTQ